MLLNLKFLNNIRGEENCKPKYVSTVIVHVKTYYETVMYMAQPPPQALYRIIYRVRAYN